ncbi:hypothetical protein FISHEDRAFT_77653 [Fistulina hepatica ATCC 64428]|uniref:Uncharacterized protein n=1 Tax=Fistulina hepatica ATCC 64428 TaxID=1128425 RepID=A0A0D7A3H9_9AGAR|nr:hypothetical protein FISHEDRAFT_77653 [Fistulina hepatica ATCC 64428]
MSVHGGTTFVHRGVQTDPTVASLANDTPNNVHLTTINTPPDHQVSPNSQCHELNFNTTCDLSNLADVSRDFFDDSLLSSMSFTQTRDKSRSLKYPNLSRITTKRGPRATNMRVISLPETVPETSVLVPKPRVVSLPEPSEMVNILARPRLCSSIRSSVLASPSRTDISVSSVAQSSFCSSTRSLFDRPRAIRHDMPRTPTPPSSPESIFIIGNDVQIPSSFLPPGRVALNAKRREFAQVESPPKPIPALHGPLSLPYARCPSGAEGTIVEGEDMFRMIWGLDEDGRTKQDHHSLSNDDNRYAVNTPALTISSSFTPSPSTAFTPFAQFSTPLVDVDRFSGFENDLEHVGLPRRLERSLAVIKSDRNYGRDGDTSCSGVDGLHHDSWSIQPTFYGQTRNVYQRDHKSAGLGILLSPQNKNVSTKLKPTAPLFVPKNQTSYYPHTDQQLLRPHAFQPPGPELSRQTGRSGNFVAARDFSFSSQFFPRFSPSMDSADLVYHLPDLFSPSVEFDSQSGSFSRLPSPAIISRGLAGNLVEGHAPYSARRFSGQAVVGIANTDLNLFNSRIHMLSDDPEDQDDVCVFDYLPSPTKIGASVFEATPTVHYNSASLRSPQPPFPPPEAPLPPVPDETASAHPTANTFQEDAISGEAISSGYAISNFFSRPFSRSAPLDRSLQRRSVPCSLSSVPEEKEEGLTDRSLSLADESLCLNVSPSTCSSPRWLSGLRPAHPSHRFGSESVDGLIPATTPLFRHPRAPSSQSTWKVPLVSASKTPSSNEGNRSKTTRIRPSSGSDVAHWRSNKERELMNEAGVVASDRYLNQNAPIKLTSASESTCVSTHQDKNFKKAPNQKRRFKPKVKGNLQGK